MSDILSTIFPCITRRKPWLSNIDQSRVSTSDEKTVYLTSEEAAHQIVDVLLQATKEGSPLTGCINDIAHQAGGWSEWLAEQIRKGIEEAISAGKEMSPVFAAAHEKAREAATVFEHFAEDHPVATAIFITVLAIGILVIIAPYVVELIGFGELGPIEGTWAAAWQSTYRGIVPKGSLFSFFQKLGMTWK